VREVHLETGRRTQELVDQEFVEPSMLSVLVPPLPVSPILGVLPVPEL
jgi:hypothetical protein